MPRETNLDNQKNANPNSKGGAILEKENPVEIKIMELGNYSLSFKNIY